MSQTLKAAIDEIVQEVSVIEAEIAAKLAEAAPLKLAANTLAKKVGIAEPFTDVNSPVATTTVPRVKTVAWRSDQFFNRPLAECVSEILETRKASGKDGPASMDEIFDALKAGNYRFGGSGSDENSKRAVKISLTKNNQYFAKIGEDSFGLRKWYGPGRPMARKSNGSKGGDSQDDQEAEEVTEEQAVFPEVEAGQKAEEEDEIPG
jgi:hypothetical protein